MNFHLLRFIKFASNVAPAKDKRLFKNSLTQWVNSMNLEEQTEMIIRLKEVNGLPLNSALIGQNMLKIFKDKGGSVGPLGM